MKLAILASLFLTSMASAATIPLPSNSSILSTPATEDAQAIFFPGTATAAGTKIRTQITNAELLKRGQPLAKPAKLYDAIELAKRIAPAPPLASSMPAAGGTQKSYAFAGCTTQSFFDGSTYSVGSTDLQQIANECATRSQVDGASTGYPARFVIRARATNNCYTKVSFFTAGDCTSENQGVYEIVP